jgi:hypothetical protein
MSPVVVALIVAAGGPSASSLQGDMAPLYAAVSWLAPRAATGELEKSDDVKEALNRLSAHAKRLEKHVPGDDPAARAIARGLSRSARFARARYERGDRVHAASIVRSMTASCTACHVRNPRSDAAFSKGFTLDPRVAKLKPVARARLFAAVRQTEAALDALKGRPLDKDAAWLTLELTVRGQGDLDAAKARLVGKNIPAEWRKTLDNASIPADLEAAEKLAVDPNGSDKVRALIAAHALDRSLAVGTARERARAHLILARAELVLDAPAAATPLLEACLELDPDGPSAEPALELLYEAYAKLSAPDAIPTDIERMLEEKRGGRRVR